MNEQKKIIIRRMYFNKKPVKVGEIIKFQGVNAKTYRQLYSNLFKLHKKGILKRIKINKIYHYYLNSTWATRHYDWMKRAGII